MNLIIRNFGGGQDPIYKKIESDPLLQSHSSTLQSDLTLEEMEAIQTQVRNLNQQDDSHWTKEQYQMNMVKTDTAIVPNILWHDAWEQRHKEDAIELHGYFPHEDPMNIAPKGQLLFVYVSIILQIGFILLKKIQFEIRNKDKRILSALNVQEKLPAAIKRM